MDPLLIPFPSALIGSRTVVRSYELDDAPAMKEAIDEARSTLLPWMPWAKEEELLESYVSRIRRFRANIELAEDFALGMFDYETGRYLGGTGLHRIDWELRAFDIGYWIRPSGAGKGHVTEAVQLLTRFAFETFRARRVSITCAVENSKSAAVAERAGFRKEGLLRNSILDAYGEPHDRLVYSLIDLDAEFVKPFGS